MADPSASLRIARQPLTITLSIRYGAPLGCPLVEDKLLGLSRTEYPAGWFQNRGTLGAGASKK
jgi:hypothetical protein